MLFLWAEPTHCFPIVDERSMDQQHRHHVGTCHGGRLSRVTPDPLNPDDLGSKVRGTELVQNSLHPGPPCCSQRRLEQALQRPRAGKEEPYTSLTLKRSLNTCAFLDVFLLSCVLDTYLCVYNSGLSPVPSLLKRVCSSSYTKHT